MPLDPSIKKDIRDLWNHSVGKVERSETYCQELDKMMQYEYTCFENEKETKDYILELFVREREFGRSWRGVVLLLPKNTKNSPIFGYCGETFWGKGHYEPDWIEDVWDSMNKQVEDFEKRSSIA